MEDYVAVVVVGIEVEGGAVVQVDIAAVAKNKQKNFPYT